MASIIKVGDRWRAQIRRKGHASISETFPTKTLAQKWATETEASINARRYRDERSLDKITLAELIQQYREELSHVEFGKNKTAVLTALENKLGHHTLAELSDDRLTQYIKDRRREGAGGVTIAIDLTYLGGIFKTARQIWKIPVSMDAITTARAYMSHVKISTRSKERTRRPSKDELDRLCDYFDGRSRMPMRDIIQFAVATAMRLDEIMRVRWDDLNETDKTIVIRDRKHPNQKLGNDQEVPLLGESFEIVKRQPKVEDRIFPYNGKTISSIFPRACQALGIEDLRFHDLRHEGVSRLFERGFRIEQVSLVSGHRDWKMLKRYTQLKAADLHRVLPA
ncbi:XerC Integrase [uncultured Caudovirales phage]|uniref:Integrase n=1 Tax=uncultured Caudovirales phage TaxID=2100421 RepID=A0A6J5KMJ4_9CAUD|nr:XerC Integrase [uncultured Caudovirales phage]